MKEAKHIYKPSDSMKGYIMKKPPPEPVFRGLLKKPQHAFSEARFMAIVHDAKEKQIRGEIFKDERLLTNL